MRLKLSPIVVPLLLAAMFLSGAAETVPAPVAGLTPEQSKEFSQGAELFNTEWQAAPAGKGKRDGLGPFYHAASCAACHPGGGRGLSPDAADAAGMPVFRLGTTDDSLVDEYGAQLSPRAVHGIKPEGSVAVTWKEVSGAYADKLPWSLRRPSYTPREWAYGTPPADVQFSPRIAPSLFGNGLLEAVPQKTLEALQDPEDKNGDGISGRLNKEDTWEGYHAAVAVAGRFGWKAWMPTIMRQVCGALGEDMGVTNVFQPFDVTPAQAELLEDKIHRPPGGGNEARGRDLAVLVAFVRCLPAPARHSSEGPNVAAGAGVFQAAGCAACHLTELKTGTVRGMPSLSGQLIHPYTDLLVHDMGPDLADNRTEAEAGGTEWRTAPLWGLSRAVDEQGRGILLHDGRARSLEEAILWHGGEAQKARDAFNALSAPDRAALKSFLLTL